MHELFSDKAPVWKPKLPNGELLYFENGQIHEQLSYLFGQRNGVSKTFYASGSKKSETFYLDGIKHGISTSYGEDGTETLEVYDQGTNILE